MSLLSLKHVIIFGPTETYLIGHVESYRNRLGLVQTEAMDSNVYYYMYEKENGIKWDTETDRDGQRQRETERDRQRQTETDGDRQRQRE